MFFVFFWDSKGWYIRYTKAPINSLLALTLSCSGSAPGALVMFQACSKFQAHEALFVIAITLLNEI